ncbi:GntR family transcriptional regulator [Glutamicibacter sp. AOP38-B1-38]|uniref:GntR family transcriptional regulator n=1 Tax=Glutamicibacter sp. AOP38-B1-38 TaxID=3457680 RepID=UPI0040342DD4
MIITLSDSGTPIVDQIRDQILGLITSGLLSAGQKLPSVRQLANDLGIAPGTVAKAYTALEGEGFLVTRIGSGTRVSANGSATPGAVLSAATHLVKTSKSEAVELDETIRILRAIWSTS